MPILQSQVTLASITCLYYRAKSLLLLSHVPILTTEPSHSCFYHIYLYYRAKSLLLLLHVHTRILHHTLVESTSMDRHMMFLFHHLNTLSTQQQRKRCKVKISCLSIHTCTPIYKICRHTYLYSVNCCPRDYTCTCIRTHTCTSHKHMPLVIMRTIRIHQHTSKQAIIQDCCHSLGNPRLQS